MSLRKIAFFLLLVLFFVFPVPAPLIIIIGLTFAFFPGNPFPENSEKYNELSIKFSIILLGFAPSFWDFTNIFNLGFSFASIFVLGVLVLCLLIFGFIRKRHRSGVLQCFGFAYGGNAAVRIHAPFINADDCEKKSALSVILTIDILALFLVPVVGFALNLTKYEFAIWTAIAIPDTLFALAASSLYSTDAFLIATIINILKFSFILPAVLSMLFLRGKKKKPRIPWFLLLFFVVFLFRNNLPLFVPTSIYDSFENAARSGFAVALFLTGTLFSRDTFKSIRIKPLIFGLIFWFVLAFLSLLAIMRWI